MPRSEKQKLRFKTVLAVEGTVNTKNWWVLD